MKNKLYIEKNLNLLMKLVLTIIFSIVCIDDIFIKKIYAYSNMNKDVTTIIDRINSLDNKTNSSTSLSIEEDNKRMVIDLFVWIGIAIVFFFIKLKQEKKDFEKKIKIYCDKCGAANSKSNNFCIKCGEKLKNK